LGAEKKIEATLREILENAAESPPSTAHFVRCFLDLTCTIHKPDIEHPEFYSSSCVIRENYR